ncbi:hypothetical protein Alches_12560 [Alicyclobacillus hesperidum subsp. aegles]|uniref:hypothetical protein n=1 Tax=Alicyclobacillus hesperidum TaxID=89784 RepID=UPI00222C0765|nr:hypothetical protein [Alicyclobacillus hesperidum]GLG01217.1 hypothetical protein Alches_12560 [Alicyclobacillus hesperidum subsp. aegles]
MKHKQWITAGLALSIVGMVAGCATGNSSTPVTNNSASTNSTQSVTNNTAQQTNSTTVNNTTGNTNTSNPAGSNANSHSSGSVTTQSGGNGQPLNALTYTKSQLSQIKQTAKNQSIQTPYALSKSGGNSGVYKLAQVSGKNNVMKLTYENITVYEATYFDNISNALQALAKGNKMDQESSLTLSNGQKAQWWKITYSSGSIVYILTVQMNNTWIALMPPASQAPHKPLTQAIAATLTPVSSIS